MPTPQDLADIEAIKQLKARYFRGVDTKDWDLWRTVFADDVEILIDLTAPASGVAAARAPLVTGGDAWVAQTRGQLVDVRTVHHGHMPEIAITGPDSATGVWSMEDIVELPGGRILHGYGHYHEQYAKLGGAWRIERLHLTRLRLDYVGPWSQAELAAMAGGAPG